MRLLQARAWRACGMPTLVSLNDRTSLHADGVREICRQMLDEGPDRWQQALPVGHQRGQDRIARHPIRKHAARATYLPAAELPCRGNMIGPSSPMSCWKAEISA